MVIDILKCKGQWLSLRHVLVILMIFFKHILSSIIHLRCLYEILSGLEVEELLHLAIELIKFSSENPSQNDDVKDRISSRISFSTCWSEAMLNDKWSVNQRLFISRHVLRSKNDCFMSLTVLLNCFQSSRLLEDLYTSKSLLYLAFYQLLEWTIVLMIFKFCPHILDGVCKFVDNTIKAQRVNNIVHINVSKSLGKIFDKQSFFFTILDNGMLSGINVFFNYWNNNS